MSRSTPEALLLGFGVALAAVLVLATVGVVIVEIDNPATDTTAVTAAIGGVFSALLGIAIGFALGFRSRGDA